MLLPTVRIPADNARGFKVINADDPRAKEAGHAEGQGIRTEGRAQEVTRTDIARMAKADIADLLTMHGVDPDPKAKVQDLRAMASRVVFADL